MMHPRQGFVDLPKDGCVVPAVGNTTVAGSADGASEQKRRIGNAAANGKRNCPPRNVRQLNYFFFEYCYCTASCREANFLKQYMHPS
jgi:hypothetical protein